MLAQVFPASPLAPMMAQAPSLIRIFFATGVFAGVLALVFAPDLGRLFRVVIGILLGLCLFGLIVTGVTGNLHFASSAGIAPPATTGPFLDNIVAIFVSGASSQTAPVVKAASWIAGIAISFELIFVARDFAMRGAGIDGPESVILFALVWLSEFAIGLFFANHIGQINSFALSAMNSIGASMSLFGSSETANQVALDGGRVSAAVAAAMPHVNPLNPLDDLGLLNLNLMRLFYSFVIMGLYGILAGEIALAQVVAAFTITITAMMVGFAFCRFTRHWAMMWPGAIVTCSLVLISMKAISGLGGYSATYLKQQIAGKDASDPGNFMQVGLFGVFMVILVVSVPSIVAFVANKQMGVSGGGWMIAFSTNAAALAARAGGLGGGDGGGGTTDPILSPGAQREAATEIPPESSNKEP